VAEQVERLAETYEIHLYSTRVEDMDLTGIVWRRIPALPGPHLVNYLWWFGANHLWRWWDRRFHGFAPDVVYSPGINCLDADVISVHIVFAEFYRRVKEELSLRCNPLRAWPRLAHRRVYYGLIQALERRIYTREDLPLAVISNQVGKALAGFYRRTNHLRIVYHGCDSELFDPARRSGLRDEARRTLKLERNAFVALLIGNDWKNKGLPCLLEALGRLRCPAVELLVVGQDIHGPYQDAVRRHGLEDAVHFLPPRLDVEFYYAAADAYVGASLEDAFGLPVLEAMACGLPVIASGQAGVSEVITHGVDGLILEDPRDAAALAMVISELDSGWSLR